MTPILVDTSLWVEHLRIGHPKLASLLLEGEVATHPFVVGELACGNIKNRREILSLLQALPAATVAENDEVLRFIDNHRLMGLGLGYTDVHVLASAALSHMPLWTADKQLHNAAWRLRLAFA
ncbi:MAG: PIN domain-containing protein [bacterium]